MSAPISNVSQNETAVNLQPGVEFKGLVQYHISDRMSAGAVSCEVFADVTELHQFGGQPVGGGLRGEIRGFTPQSRKRLLECLARTRDVETGLFVTLTYPAEFPTDPKIYHAHLNSLIKRLKRTCPEARGVWRLEFQKRGAPHFHLLIFGVPHSARNMRRWFKVAWYQVVGSGDLKHLEAGTQCDPILSRKHANRYAAKYAAKVDHEPTDQPTGRLWGHFGQLDQTSLFFCILTRQQTIEFRRLVVRWLASRGMRYGRRLSRMTAGKGFSVFGLGDESAPFPGLPTVVRMLDFVRDEYPPGKPVVP